MRKILSLSLLLALMAPPAWAAADVNQNPLAVLAAKIIELSNQARQQNGVGQVYHIPYLSEAATGHSAEMMQLNYFSHMSPTPGRQTPKNRIELSGGWELATAENIYRAVGIPSDAIAQKVVDAWMKSPVHRKNLLNPLYNGMGVGLHKVGENEWAITQLFAYQSIAFNKWEVKPSGSGYEIDAQARVVTGSENGIVMFDNKLLNQFNGKTFDIKTKTDKDGMMVFGQKKPDGKFTVVIQLPVSKKVSTTPQP